MLYFITRGKHKSRLYKLEEAKRHFEASELVAVSSIIAYPSSVASIYLLRHPYKLYSRSRAIGKHNPPRNKLTYIYVLRGALRAITTDYSLLLRPLFFAVSSSAFLLFSFIPSREY